MAAATLDGGHVGVRHQRQDVAGLDPYVLYPQVTGHLVADVTQRLIEVSPEEPFPVTQEQVLERIEERALYLLDVRIVGIHQWQFLFVHQYARRYRCNQVITLIDQPR